MAKQERAGDVIDHVERGMGFLFWGWIVVGLLNLTMVGVALALFAP